MKANIRKMRQDLALLPLWYAEKGNYVFVEEMTSPRFISRLPKEIRPLGIPVSREDLRKKADTFPLMHAAPWGLSPQSVAFFNELKGYGLNLTVPEWKEDYAALSSRRTAAACLKEIGERLPKMQLPQPPVFFSDMEEMPFFMERHTPPFIVKTPYSSSGRGLRWIKGDTLNLTQKNWIKGSLGKQHELSIEEAVRGEKIMDFAMEFYSDGKGNVKYEGLSHFHTKKGAYTGNILGGEEDIRRCILCWVKEKHLQCTQEAVTKTLKATYAHHYTGYLGVDMMIYKGENNSKAIHPCVEINMRRTMGLLAIRLYQNYIHPDATATLDVLYNANSTAVYQEHVAMKKEEPLIFEDGKLRSGYLPLCPVTRQTHYTAYIIVS
ncbi:MAG: hypothetical protein LBQ39_03410 [Tannerellaceae bacterium]|nr:hypothetical protein [Tannerellaceae bacterium]